MFRSSGYRMEGNGKAQIPAAWTAHTAAYLNACEDTIKAKSSELIAVRIEVYGRGSSDFVQLLAFVTKQLVAEVRIEEITPQMYKAINCISPTGLDLEPLGP